MNQSILSGQWGRAVAGAWLLLLASCATAAAARPAATAPVFYPPDSDSPRIQFLTSVSSEADLGSRKSKFAEFIVGKTEPKGLILKPYGLAWAGDQLLVADTGADAIHIFDFGTRRYRLWAPANPHAFVTPVNLAVDTDGTRYVADSARGQVLIFRADGTYSGSLGERVGGAGTAHGGRAPQVKADGVAPALTMRPADVLIDGDRLYVADVLGATVRVFDKAKREQLFTIPRDPADAAAKLSAPTNLARDTDGRLYVSDTGAFRVQQFDADGKLLRTFGRAGDALGEFGRPKGIAVDREKRLYVVDAASQAVQIFNSEGRLLLFFGEPSGGTVPLELPAKVVVDYDHVRFFAKYAAPDFAVEYLVLVTAQYGSRKVNVYGFGHKK